MQTNTRKRWTRRCFHSCCLLLLILLMARQAQAHEGPPFPILMDQPAANYKVSVWADPDIGEALFYIIVETPDGEQPAELPSVSMWTEPTSGRLPKETWLAEKMALRNQLQFEAHPEFDQRDFWTVGFTVTPPGGSPAELTTEVESTPPGYGRWDLVIYLFPFALLGGMWVFAALRHIRRMRAASESRASNSNETSVG